MCALQEHLMDVNGFVRARTLQTWLTLAQTPDALPRARQTRLLGLVVDAMRDIASTCRKLAVRILRQLLIVNPFAGKVPDQSHSQTSSLRPSLTSWADGTTFATQSDTIGFLEIILEMLHWNRVGQNLASQRDKPRNSKSLVKLAGLGTQGL